MNKKILIVAAHPDDEILGCGASVRKLLEHQAKAKTVILSKGMVSRGNNFKKYIEELLENSTKANSIIGIDNLSFQDFPDNSFDKVPLIEIVKVVEKEIVNYKPNIIFTHFGNDPNIDHRITFQAVLTACRPQKEYPASIYSFYIPSSTDWIDNQVFGSFNPNIFFDVKETIERKLDALKEYKTEMRDYPHSRSIESLRNFSKYWGNRVCKEYVEPFILVRSFNLL